MPGFKPAKAMVYAGIFPVDSSDFPKLEESIKRVSFPVALSAVRWNEGVLICDIEAHTYRP